MQPIITTVSRNTLSAEHADDMLMLLQAGLEAGVYDLHEVVANFPKGPVPLHDEHEGPLYFILWQGRVMAAARSKYFPDIEEIALDYCQNTGNPFAKLGLGDPFGKDGYYLAPNGKTVTKKYLNIVPWHKALQQISPFPQVSLRYYQPHIEHEESHSEEKEHQQN